MAELTNTNQLQAMAESLRQYDVVDGGWVHEDKGLDFNLKHVGLHLSDMVDRKDFTDKDVVRNEIAPDCIGYALRIARWGGFTVKLLGSSEYEAEQEVQQDEVIERAKELGAKDYSDYVAIIRANGILARDRHDFDHYVLNPESTEHDTHALVGAGSMLLFAAELQSLEYHFDLQQAFDNRLAGLRKRFNIPQSTAE